jgi:P-type Ca2+ transporter type 2C
MVGGALIIVGGFVMLTGFLVPAGPPSQSLGVDPVDPAIMKKPPRKKDESIITRRLLYRVLFSASIIVVGTLFLYMFALSDDHMSRREQTMVSR